jgi:hypothetical protein
MNEKLEILLFSLFGIWVILIPMIMILKIKYFKLVRHKEYNGVSDIFHILSSEWWIAGITIPFPIFGKTHQVEVNKVRKMANLRLMGFYSTILVQIVIVGLLNS